MAESTSAALAAASIPSSAEISRAEKLVRERFLHEGEDPAIALAPGSARRRALDQALAELQADPKAKRPSTAWRREFSLLLGLERLLSEPGASAIAGSSPSCRNRSRTSFSAREISAELGMDAAASAAEVDSAIEALDFETEPPQDGFRLCSERRRSAAPAPAPPVRTGCDSALRYSTWAGD